MGRKTKGLLGGLAVAVLAGLAIKAFQPQIGTALVARVAGERAGRDATVGLPDGLHVILCGSGSPFPDPTRAGPCTMVIAGRHIYVVDAGEGGAPNLTLMGLPTGRIGKLFLTHFHSDQIAGLGPMLLRRAGLPSASPLPVAGPPGVEGVVAGFNAAYAADKSYRTAHHWPAIMPPSGAGAAAEPFAFPETQQIILDSDGVRITAFRVDHGPVETAVSYRFDYKGRSVVLSGDTLPSASLIAAAKGADLLVHEALAPNLVAKITDALAATGIGNTAQITRDILNYHTTPEQAGDMAQKAAVKASLLHHIVPPMPFRFAYPAFLGDAGAHFDGPITVGEDGIIVSTPANNAKITNGRLL